MSVLNTNLKSNMVAAAIVNPEYKGVTNPNSRHLSVSKKDTVAVLNQVESYAQNFSIDAESKRLSDPSAKNTTQMIEFIGKRSFGSFQMNIQMKLQKNEG